MFVQPFDYMIEVNQRVNDNLNSVSIPGTLTGFHEIDEKGGFQPSNLIICAAESSQGKTASPMLLRYQQRKAGKHCFLFYGNEWFPVNDKTYRYRIRNPHFGINK